MEDVVLHYRPGPAAGLGCLLERTEKLLESFPCRTPPVFAPWSPAAADRHLPIRPARPPPVITCSPGSLVSDSSARPAGRQLRRPEVQGLVAHELHPLEPKDAACIPETQTHLLPERGITRPPPGSYANQHDGRAAATDSLLRRSWSVFTQKGILLQSSPPPSKRFHRMVSAHRLHLHQRAKWVIGQHHWAAAGDIERAWQTLSRCVQTSRLPTCNANIQRERAEIWVFCDVLHSEQVGRFLKDELQLSGRIGLSVHRLGHVFSM